ncbi:hypothetical protein FOA52_005015 [Chlamydomonas sp. UWO 241]|nr:hypothetical protein FOA52_005015 [Chlamydomonas sp. UWO 241]
MSGSGSGGDGSEKEKTRCTRAGVVAADTASKQNLRCRFGSGAEVPGMLEDDGAVACSLPNELGSDKKTTVRVLEGEDDDHCLAEHDFDAERRMLLPVGSVSGGDLEPENLEKKESRKDYLKREYKALKPFCIISLSYLLFTTTDGAIRMIVLLHAYNNGFTAMEVAIMFTLYELAGVITNLVAGVAGAKWGIKYTLMTGLTIQIAGIAMLFAWQKSWGLPGQKYKAIIFVTCSQMLCGIAKDLTKLGGKTVTKLITPDEKQTRLFKLVSFITGMKNSMKGLGYFIGSAAVAFNYYFALGLLIFLILLAYPWACFGLSNQLGRTRKENLTLAVIFRQSYNVNVLSISRFFLFGSRDLWFEVPLPFFLRDKAVGLGWSSTLTGLVLALFIIIYGQFQAWSPQLILSPLRQMPANKYTALLWCALLVGVPLYLGGTIQGSDIFFDHDINGMIGVLMAGLALFCFIFAVNSSVHSYLIVRYAEGDKVAMNVGFYYMANAMGRLVGTLVSGALYSYVGGGIIGGFAACFFTSFAFALCSTIVDFFIKDDVGGLMCGACLPIVAPPPPLPPKEGFQAEAVAPAEIKIEMA